MDWTDIVCAALSALCAVAAALISRRGASERKERGAREELRREEALLAMELQVADSELCDVIAIAVSGGHVNGNVEAAREKARAARERYGRFLRESMAGEISKS